MKSAFRSPVLRFLVLFCAMLGVALGLAAMSTAPEAGADAAQALPSAHSAGHDAPAGAR